MAAIANLGFAIQAADVGTRSVLGIRRNLRDVQSERAGRVEDVLRTIEMYENVIENLSSGGAALIAESDEPLRCHIVKVVATLHQMKVLFLDADVEMQACPDAIEAQVMDETKWLRFRSLKSEMEIREKGLQVLAISRILQYGARIGSISDSTSRTVDQIYESMQSPTYPDMHLRNSHTLGNMRIIPSARDLAEITSAHDPFPSSAFLRAKRSSDMGSRCFSNRCLCSCHEQSFSSWGCVHFRHTQTRSFCTPCTRTSCNTRTLKATAAVDLSWTRIRFVILASLELFCGLGRFSIRPSLEVKRVVAPDSRGFKISKKFRTGQYSAEQAIEAFREAFQNGEASLMDFTPDGRSLTESMMEINSLEAAKESCRDITYLLKTIAGHSAVMECLPAIFKFCETAVEFGGIDPFEIINELGIIHDVAGEDILWFHQFVCDSSDPFGIKWLQNCHRKCLGFANVPPLIREILLSDFRTFNGATTVSIQSVNETFLGLPALHWATCSESWVRELLQAGHDVSLVDQWGNPPLIYAAAYGRLGTLLALLEAGADPTVSSPRPNGCQQNFLQYAIYHGHFHIVLGSMNFFARNSVRGFDIAQTLLDRALSLCCRYLYYSGRCIPPDEYDRPSRATTVQKLLALGANPNILQNDGDNLLHQLGPSDIACARLILSAGMKHLNVGNTTGETPAMRAAYDGNAPLLQLYLETGARIPARDNHGRNVVHYVVRDFHRDLSQLYSQDLWWRYSTLKMVLSHNVDANVGDHCRCACSLNGCSPPTMLMKQLFAGWQYGFRPSGLVLSMEWLLLLQELVSHSAAEKALVEFARFLLFQISGLTHVCCRPKVYGMSWWQESPIDSADISEILDEEQELIAAIEEELRTMRSPFDQRDPAEAWADMLIDFAKKHEDLARSNDAAKTSFRHALLHYRHETSELLRAVYQDDATFRMRFEQRQALVTRCLDRLKAK